ncbi:CRTAC1 family protein [Gloeobacter morelensis]|uniref:CRTAC1 family protein n=1 Tax=Gloeobacter morelensis MG652769 TaxID=2781736 RepID=A0ABY3PS21_9CYAN|nr:CRTAC1 family protein [Gloeobacter morelensis]UFP96314.1 CRTAC1 family protein [Gloeobacter morelensis MG652769]
MTALSFEKLRLHSGQIAAGALILGFWGLARLPELPAHEQRAMAQRFHFKESPLPAVSGPAHQFIRKVHPDLEHIAAWISASGAFVALNDFDRDGLANDVCYVETRTDQVIVAPAPGTGERYRPFTFEPGKLPFDQASIAPMGCQPGDFNEDGRTDAMVYYFGRSPILFIQQPTTPAETGFGPARFAVQELVPKVERWYTIATTMADIDGDGHQDLYIGNYFGDGSRLLGGGSRETGRPAGGWMQHSFSRGNVNGGSQRIYLGKGTGQFAEAAGFEGEMARSWSLAVGAADIDGDQLPEIYVANDFGPDRLFHNRSTPGRVRLVSLEGERTLTTPTSKVLGKDSFKGMGIDFGDIDRDGRLDMFVTNITQPFGLQESNFAFINTGNLAAMAGGLAPFTDRSEALGLSRSYGWGWEVRLNDFDNDGELEALQAVGFLRGTINRWPELQEAATGSDELVANPATWPQLVLGDDLSSDRPNPFFVRDSRGRYFDLAKDIGLGRPRVSRGIATADVDGDGRLDFATGDQFTTSYFYANQSPKNGQFLGLHVLLPPAGQAVGSHKVRSGHPGADTPGRPAIGAEATLELPDGRKFISQIDGGNGHAGKRAPELHFGLGTVSAGTPVRVALRWRDGEGRVHRDRFELTTGWHTVVLGPTHASKKEM